MIDSLDPYRGVVVVIEEAEVSFRARYGEFVVLAILLFNIFVVGVLWSWA